MVRRFGSARGVLALALALAAFGASTAHAHIKLLKPASWLVLDSFGGPDQKTGPCGTGTMSNMVTTYMAGETITVEWEETIAHPGYFRIAVVENRTDLKDPDIVTQNKIDSFCNYPEGAVSSTAVPPVLVDKLFETIEYPTTRGKMSTEVTLPNTPCEKCTLQLIQYMRDHTQPCIYYHCADIKIVASNGGAGSGAAGTAAGGAGGAAAGSGGESGGGSGASGASGSASGMGGMVGSTAGGSGSPSGMAPMPPPGGASGNTGSAGMTTAAGASGGAAVPPAAPASTSDSSCATSAPRGGSQAGLLLGLLLLGWVRLRRRR